jgi:hypothetical protein
MSAADIQAAVNTQACNAVVGRRCLVKKPIPYTQAVFLLVLFIVGLTLLAFYFRRLRDVGIWLPITIIVVLLIILVVAAVAFIPACLLYRSMP